jgi:tRNA A-37 threonylcarbamoyl transferase component Bud32
MRNATDQLVRERETEALTFGRYELTRKLSQGGMAEIYLARQSGVANFEKQVVIKIVLPSLAAHDGYEDMLLNEARMAARLNHPNIVQILDVGKLDDRFFIAMEYLDGESLSSIVQRAQQLGRRLPIGFVCRVIGDVLSGLEYAHALAGSDGKGLGIIHRDISPPNVIVTWAGSTKIVDFGIAKATRLGTSAVTDAGQFKGKLSYMSPEQVTRQALDARSDIFSTGVLLWELLTGRRLFRRASDQETLRALLEDPVPASSLFHPGCPAALDQIIGRATQRTVQGRYPSARAMRRAIEEVIRQHGWAADPMTMQRVMSELFGARKVTAEIAAPEAKAGAGSLETDPTTRTRKVAAEGDDTDPDDVIVEMTAPFETMTERLGSRANVRLLPPAPATVKLGANTIDRIVRLRRLGRIALGAAIGLTLCAALVLGRALWRGSHASPSPSPSSLAAAPASPSTAQPSADVPAAPPAESARAGEAAPPAQATRSANAAQSGESAQAAQRARAAQPAGSAPASPAKTQLEVRVDGKAQLLLDGAPIAANAPVALAPGGAHVLSVQRPGHRARKLTLPALEAGERLVIAVWRDLPDAKPAPELVGGDPVAERSADE